jgi:dihydroorotate dehydrogenase
MTAKFQSLNAGGGVGSGHDAYAKLKAGASLVQVYSMMVYKGRVS